MLERIKIASPCKANWEQMAGDERVRHCAECNLDVYNLSAMTRREVEHLVQEREGRLCARFYRRADGYHADARLPGRLPGASATSITSSGRGGCGSVGRDAGVGAGGEAEATFSAT